MTVRVSWRGLAIGAALAFALAGPAKADGLAQFDKLLKPMVPPGALTYKSASALGDSGFVLEDVTITEPPAEGGEKKPPVAVKKITVEEFDFAGFEKDHAPNFLKTRIEGIAIGGKPADGVDLKELIGVDHLTADFQLDLRLDPDKKVLTLKTLALDLNGLGHIEVSLILDGVEGDPAQRDKDMDNAVLRTASLTFEDRSMLGKLVPAVAKMQGSDAAATVGMAKTMLEGARAGQGQATQAAFDALASFLDDYKKPKGPLTVTLKPDGKLSGASLKNAAGPDDVIKALGLGISYAGTVPHPSAPVKQ